MATSHRELACYRKSAAQVRSQPLPGAIKAGAGWLWSSQGGAPVSGMEPWPPATVDLASAPRAHPTSERPAARAQLEFGRAPSLAAAARTAAGEDRTHDLRIMIPTRYQLRYCRGYQSFVRCLVPDRASLGCAANLCQVPSRPAQLACGARREVRLSVALSRGRQRLWR